MSSLNTDCSPNLPDPTVETDPSPTASAGTDAVEDAVRAAARAARDAQPRLARLTRDRKDALLAAMAEALVEQAPAIIAANARDLEAADAAGRRGSRWRCRSPRSAR